MRAQTAQLFALLDASVNTYAPEMCWSTFVTSDWSPLPPGEPVIILPDVGTVGMHVSVAPPPGRVRADGKPEALASIDHAFTVVPDGLMCYPASRPGAKGIAGNDSFRRLGWCTLRVQVSCDAAVPDKAQTPLQPADLRYFHVSFAQVGWKDTAASSKSRRSLAALAPVSWSSRRAADGSFVRPGGRGGAAATGKAVHVPSNV